MSALKGCKQVQQLRSWLYSFRLFLKTNSQCNVVREQARNN